MERPVLVHDEALGDLDHASTVAALGEACATAGGRRALGEIMSSPTYCPELLRLRARDIAALAPVAEGIRDRLAALRDHEEGAVWCSTPVEDLDDDTAALLREPYFRGVAKPLNGLWPALWASNAYAVFAAPAIAGAAPLTYLLAPYFIIRFKLKLPLDFRTFVRLMYHSFKGAGAAMKIAFGDAPTFAMQLASVAMTCVMYFQAVIASFRHSIKLVGVCRRVAGRMNSTERVLAACDELADRRGAAFYRRWAVGFEPRENAGPRVRRFPEQVRPWRTGFARALHDFALLDRGWVRHRLRQLFHLDAVCALCAGAARYRMRPVHFLPADTQAILLSGGRRLRDDDHPNSLAMAKGVNGLMLTGANASGKSTVLRMLGCAVLVAQTTGLAPAAAMAIHPIKYLTTMMGIRDDPERGRSRFQNELLRAGECVEAARRRPSDFGLLLMDEIFGGTDPAQGDVCGGRVLTSLAETPSCMYLLATHQKGLVRHAAGLPSSRSYKMTPGYRLAPGVNDLHNAADLFESQVAAKLAQ